MAGEVARSDGPVSRLDDGLYANYRGSAAEHLVCADLLMRGVAAALAPHGHSYDVLVDHGGILLRLEVKSSHSPQVAERDFGLLDFYSFTFSSKSKGVYRPKTDFIERFDLAAVVATDICRIGYLAASEVRQVIHVASGHLPGRRRRNFDAMKFEDAFGQWRRDNNSEIADVPQAVQPMLFGDRLR